MKKVISFLLAVLLILSVTGCAGGSAASSGSAPSAQPAGADSEASGEAVSSAPADAAVSEAPASEGAAVSSVPADAAVSGAQASEDAAVSAAAEAADTDAADEEILRFTMCFVDPDSSPYVEGGKKIAELVSLATDGRILIEVEGSSKAGERELVERAMDNELDIATCANSVLTNYIPQMNILDQPYLWQNAEEAHAAVDGKLGDLIEERAETLGLHVLGYEESGFRNIFSKDPIETIGDFRGVTIRTMENKYHQAAFEAFGADPVAMPYPEVLEALRSGKINACENATPNCLNSGYFEVTKHITNTKHAFVYILLLMSDEAWARVPEELREPLLEAVREGVEWEREHLLESVEAASEELRALGVTFHDIDTSALQAAYREMAEKKHFAFDPEWTAAVDEAVREAAADKESRTK